MVNVALVIGRAGSSGLKGKNTRLFLGRPLMSYPILAAKNTGFIDRVFLSTDSLEMAEIGKKYGAEYIERPSELATNQSLSEHAFLHGYQEIVKRVGADIETVTLMFCNGATIKPGILDEGIDVLRRDKSFDSAVTVSKYNMWSPLRARKIDDQGCLVPFIEPSFFGAANCDRDSQGDTYFADCSAFVVRPHCFDYAKYGQAPFPWIGKKVYPLKQWGGLDIDYEWQVGQVEFWLKEHGFSETRTPYDK